MTNPADIAASADTSTNDAVAQGGAYEVLRKRLADQGIRLRGIADALNTQRLQEFGDSKMEIAGRFRIRSEQNAVGRDIVQVGDLLLFGYNVFLGLKSTTSVADVFGLYKLVETADGYDVTPVDPAHSFLADPAFVRDFTELYAYYKEARLLQLLVKDSKLLAAFQIGADAKDVRVFRWNLSSTGEIGYIDARGERDISLPPPFDFEWTRATRDLMVAGRVVKNADGTEDVAIMMVEAEATEGSWNLIKSGAIKPDEAVVAQGLEASKPFIAQLVKAQEQLAAQSAKEVQDYPVFLPYTDEVYAAVEALAEAELSPIY